MIHELRIYTAESGKMPALLARFRDHTTESGFEKHGITNVGYWLNSIGGRTDELWYIVAFESLAAREQAWASFVADPEWKKVRAESSRPTDHASWAIDIADGGPHHSTRPTSPPCAERQRSRSRLRRSPREPDQENSKPS